MKYFLFYLGGKRKNKILKALIFVEILIASISINFTLGIFQYGSSFGDLIPSDVRNKYVVIVPTVDQMDVKYITSFYKKAREQISHLQGVEEIYDIGNINVNLERKFFMNAYSYSTELFKYANIDLIKGKLSSAGYINGINYVFASSNSNLEYGREYLLTFKDNKLSQKKVKVKVAGIFVPETKLLNIQYRGTSVALDSFYIPERNCIAGAEIKDISGKEISLHSDPNVIVKLKEGITLESISSKWDKTVSSYLNYYTLQELLDSLNSKIFETAKVQVSIAVILLLMCIVGLGSSAIIKMINETREYSIYFMCGQTWGKSAALNALSNIFNILLPFFIGSMVAKVMSLHQLSNVVINLNNIFISLIIIISLFIITGAWSVIYLTKTPPIKFLRRNSD